MSNNSWKGISDMKYSVYPINVFVNRNNLVPNTGKANPLKHWRKQLCSTNTSNVYTSGSMSKTISRTLDRPGGNIITESNSGGCNAKPDVYIMNNNNTCQSNTCKNIRRNASTVISKSYYTTHSKYLYGKVKTYNQNQTLSPIPNNSSNNTYNPTSGMCSNNCITITYKPTNFTNAYITKLKYDTLNSSATTLIDSFGQSNANSAKYSGVTATYNSPYNLKSKYYIPICETYCSN